MNHLCKLFVLGNLTRDPEYKHTTTGTGVCKFSVANNREWRSNTGQPEKSVMFLPVVVWGKQGEACAKYLQKGSQVLVEGRLDIRNYEDKEGNKRLAVECVAERVTFLSKAKNSDAAVNDDNAGGGDFDDSAPF